MSEDAKRTIALVAFLWAASLVVLVIVGAFE